MEPKAMLMTQRLIWAAMLASIGIYVVVLFVVRPHDLSPEPTFLFALGAVALVESVMSFVLPRFLHKQELAKVDLAIVEEGDPNEPAFFRERAPTRRVFADAKAATRTALMCRQTPFILSLALSEAVAITGLVLGMMGFELFQAVPFLAVGALLIALRFPTEKRAVAALEEAHGAIIPRSAG